jgi:hypothetical protein
LKEQLNLVEVTVASSSSSPEEPRLLPILTDKRAELGTGVIHHIPQGDGTFTSS